MGQHTCQLRGHGDQKRLFFLVEAAAILLLHNQHPQHFALVDNGRPQERVVLLFANTR